MKDEFSLEAKFYDKIWGKYDYDTDVKFLNVLFQKHNCKRILDVGCGTGNHSIRLSKIGYEITGVDISATMLKIAKEKDKDKKIKFLRGDMRRIEEILSERQKFDAAICLGQVFSHLLTDKEVHIFLKKIYNALKKNGIFVFNAKNAKKIREEYLDKLVLDHMINEEKLQVLILGYNTRDLENPNIIVWRPIYLIKEKGEVDFQIREHKLRRFEFSRLEKMLTESGFKILAIYSSPQKEKFLEDEHNDMWFVTKKS